MSQAPQQTSTQPAQPAKAWWSRFGICPEVVANVIGGLGLVATFVFGVSTWYFASVAYRLNQEATAMQKAKEQSDQETAKKDEQLKRLMKAAADSNNIIAALEIISKQTLDLPGEAALAAADSTAPAAGPAVSPAPDLRMGSREAVAKYGAVVGNERFKGVKKFDLNHAAIQSIVVLSKRLDGKLVSTGADDTITKDTASSTDTQAKVDFVGRYVAPILFAKCQSDDPTVAAGALGALATILTNTHRSELRLLPTNSPKMAGAEGSLREFQGSLKGRIFAKVDFKTLRLNLADLGLTKADFSWANLDEPDFTRAEISGANFYNAKLVAATFTNADASQSPVNFSGVEFKNCRAFSDVVWPDVKFCGSVFLDCLVGPTQDLKGENAGLSRADFTNAQIKGGGQGKPSEFLKLRLAKATFKAATLINCRFTNCNLEEAQFAARDLNSVRFQECDIRCAKFASETVGGVSFPDSDLTGSDFSQQNPVARFDFTGAIMDWVRLPEAWAPTAKLNNTDCPLKGIRLGKSSRILLVGPPATDRTCIYVTSITRAEDGAPFQRTDSSKDEFLKNVHKWFLDELNEKTEIKKKDVPDQEKLAAEIKAKWGVVFESLAKP
ncbi:MAG: pentapeptide repeat-containing protein [Planctomycetota bacterium]|nr:pentapeptide repeat-containing protein [Planctomycetota bacterium]